MVKKAASVTNTNNRESAMCLTKQEERKMTAGWASLMLAFLVQFGGSIWWASDANSRLNFLENEANKGDRFTNEEAKIMQYQIDSLVKMNTELAVSIKEIDRKLDQIQIDTKTHTHPFNP